MKHSIRKRALALLLCALFLLTVCSCGKDNHEQVLSELNDMKQQLDAAKQELDTIKSKPASDVTTLVIQEREKATPQKPQTIEREVEVASVVGVRCKLDGKLSVPIQNGAAKVHAVADQIDGYEFDHWEINGKPDNTSGPDATFTFTEATVLRAEYHKHRVLEFINCYMRFCAANGEASGERYTKFDFEKDYKNPVTGEKCKGGEITFFVIADLQQGKEVDYWLINGVKYQAPNNAYKFRVELQDEATVYEVVLRRRWVTERSLP